MFSMILAVASIAVPASQADSIPAREQRDSAPGGQCPLELDCPSDVAGVAFATRLFDVDADRIQFPRKFLDVLGRQVCILLDVSDSHVSPRP